MDSTPVIQDLGDLTMVAWWCVQTTDDLVCGVALLAQDPFQWAPTFLGWLI